MCSWECLGRRSTANLESLHLEYQTNVTLFVFKLLKQSIPFTCVFVYILGTSVLPVGQLTGTHFPIPHGHPG